MASALVIPHGRDYISTAGKALAARRHCLESPLQVDDKLSLGLRENCHRIFLCHVALEIWIVSQDVAAGISALGVGLRGHTTVKMAAEGYEYLRLRAVLKADVHLGEHAKIP